MKKKFKTLAIAATAILTIGSVTLVSCEKTEDDPKGVSSLKVDKEIPHFSDRDAVQEALSIALSCKSTKALLEYEQEVGRTSIGATSDLFYDAVDPEIFESEEAVMNFLEKNQGVLDTINEDGEISVMPKWFNTPYRYVANKDGLFSVGDMAYRLFKNEMVATNMAYFDELIQLTEDMLCDVDTSKFHRSTSFLLDKASLGGVSVDQHDKCQSGWYYAASVQTNKDKVTIELRTSNVYYPYIGFIAETRIHTYSRHKFFGVWWICRHTLTCEGDVTLHRKNSPNSWIMHTVNIYDTEKSTGMWTYVYDSPCVYGPGTSAYHYYAYHLKAWTPGLSYALLSYN